MDKAQLLAKLISEGKVFNARTETQSNIEQSKPIEVFHEDGKRTEVAKLSETTSEIDDMHQAIEQSKSVLDNFKGLKARILNEHDTDNSTIAKLNDIEQYLEHFAYKYTEKKETFKNQYKELF